MENKNLMPIASQPVNRIATGQLPLELAELSEEALSQDTTSTQGGRVEASMYSEGCFYDYTKGCGPTTCSYDGDDAE